MSLAGLVSRLVGLGLMALAVWLFLDGEEAVTVAIVFGSGVAFFVGAGLSRK